MAAGVAAYKVYADIVSEAEAFISSTASESDEVILLSDYLDDNNEADGLFNGNGGAPYILANGLLDDVQIKSEAEYINKVFLDAKANAKADGDDCTDLLVNADFASAGGWLGVTNNSIVWPTGKTEIYIVMQAITWHAMCIRNSPLFRTDFMSLTFRWHSVQAMYTQMSMKLSPRLMHISTVLKQRCLQAIFLIT